MLYDILGEISNERENQIAKGYDIEHDDNHRTWELGRAAAAYVMWTISSASFARDYAWKLWPFEREAFKKHGERRNLIKACALLVAEIERLDRLVARNAGADRQMLSSNIDSAENE